MFLCQIHISLFTQNKIISKSIDLKVESELKTWKIYGFKYQQKS
jgi:hypothetical protein